MMADDPERGSGAVSGDHLLEALLGIQQTYAAIIRPVLESVREMKEAVEFAPPAKHPEAMAMLREFGHVIAAIARSGDFQKMQSTCAKWVTKFRRLAGH